MSLFQLDPLGTLGTIKVAKDLFNETVGPVSIRQCTQAGTVNLDRSKALLLQKGDKSGYIISAKERINLHETHDQLAVKRDHLATAAAQGLYAYWDSPRVHLKNAWNFHKETTSLYKEAVSASDRSMNALAIEEAKAELAAAEAKAKEEEEAKAAAERSEAYHSFSRGDSDNASLYYDCEETSDISTSQALGRHDYYTLPQTSAQHANHSQYSQHTQYPPSQVARNRSKYARPSEQYSPYPGSPGSLQPFHKMTTASSPC